MFAALLVIAVTIIAFNIAIIADRAQLEPLYNYDSTIPALMGRLPSRLNCHNFFFGAIIK